VKFDIPSKRDLLQNSTSGGVLQSGIKEWWESNPMTYDWSWDNVGHPEGSREFYEDIDRRFWRAAWFAHRPGEEVFTRFIDRQNLKGKRVLEIGCGAGALTAQLAKTGAQVTAVDLTSHGVGLTRKRFEVFGLEADIRQMDARNLDLPDETFDLVWSWGVIHASDQTERIIEHIHRVLKPGGEARLMVYHKSSIVYWINYMLIRGILFGGLLKHTPQELCDIYSDGLIAKVYTAPQFKSMLKKHFREVRSEICGQKDELWPIPASKFKDKLVDITPDVLARPFTDTFGWYLWALATK
jgi:ubiquinone/menaquinone biosynthesis C-methylase UbiE